MITAKPIVFVVDDEASVRTALGRLLRSAGLDVTAFESADRCLTELDPSSHGCVILDISMPGFDGLALQEAMSARGMVLPIIFLTGRGDISSSVQAMKRGAHDFLTKPVDDVTLLTAVRRALEHSRTLLQARSEVSEIDRRLRTLTPREREVLEHILAGEANKQVAADLGTVEKTIKVHRSRVMAKMQVRSLAELVRLAGRAGVQPATVERV